MAEHSTARTRLQHELLRVRDLAGISQRAMAGHVSASRETVRRFELGEALLSLPKIEAWLAAAGVDDEQRGRLLALAERVHGETRPWRELLDDDGHLQTVAHRREQSATQVRNFQPTILPGLLQTSDYARRVLTAGHTRDVDAAVTARAERQRALQESDTRFAFLIAERALRATMEPGRPMAAAQRNRLLSAMALPRVSLGVVPDSAPILSWHNFIIWEPAEGDPSVTTELVHGSQELIGDDVAVYVALWERLSTAAVFDEAAAELIREVGE